jgi:hypothetical protein
VKRFLAACCAASLLAAPVLAADPVIPNTGDVPITQEQAPLPPDLHKKPDGQKDERPILEVAFVLDTTSSMGGLIEGAKQKIWSIASRMASGKPSPRIRVGLVAYRDRGDAYVTKSFDLTEDLDAVYANLKAFRAEGGGDTPEHVGKGLADAVTQLHWSDDKRAAKMIFLVGDAPGQDYGDGYTVKVWAKKAIAKGIVVNTVRCGSQADTAAEFAEVARLADGAFISIEQSGGMVAVATPFDAEMGKLNGSIASTSIYAGSGEARGRGAAYATGLASMDAPAAADRAAYREKAPPKPSTAPAEVAALGGVDLTLAPAKVAEMKEEQLPENLRKLKPADRVALVEKNATERKELEGKLSELAKKRDAWLKANTTAKKDSFDEKVMGSVAASASKVGVAY